LSVQTAVTSVFLIPQRTFRKKTDEPSVEHCQTGEIWLNKRLNKTERSIAGQWLLAYFSLIIEPYFDYFDVECVVCMYASLSVAFTDRNYMALADGPSIALFAYFFGWFTTIRQKHTRYA